MEWQVNKLTSAIKVLVVDDQPLIVEELCEFIESSGYLCVPCESSKQAIEQFVADPAIGLVVLDELNIALKHGYLELDAVLADIEARPLLQHVVVTGRGALPGMLEAADTVTEMNLVKHAFKSGVKAQKGIEF